MHGWHVWQSAEPLAGLDVLSVFATNLVSIGQSRGMPAMAMCSPTASSTAWLYAILTTMRSALQPRRGINITRRIIRRRTTFEWYR